MIQVKKDNTNIPGDYLALIDRYHFRKIDFDSGFHSKQEPTGHALFKSIKKKTDVFDGFKTKLLIDQGYICCYCNARIELKGSTVEHIVPISVDKSLLAEYNNLLISCNGGRIDKFENRDSQIQYPLYCDAHRGDTLLPFTPLDNECWSAFNYSIVDGSVTSNHLNAQNAIDILNLDCNVLQQNRVEALEILFDDNHQLISYEELEMIWDKFWERDNGKRFEPYFFIILQNIYFLV